MCAAQCKHIVAFDVCVILALRHYLRGSYSYSQSTCAQKRNDILFQNILSHEISINLGDFPDDL